MTNKAKLSMVSKRIQPPFSRDEKELLFRNKYCTFISRINIGNNFLYMGKNQHRWKVNILYIIVL